MRPLRTVRGVRLASRVFWALFCVSDLSATLLGQWVASAADLQGHAAIADDTVTIPINGYMESCRDDTAVYTETPQGWEKVSTELPTKGNYYIDNQFVNYSMCDVIVCEKGTSHAIGLVEYKQIGEKAPPANSGSTRPMVPVYQAVPLKGAIKIDVSYFSDKDCLRPAKFSTLMKR